MAQGSCEHIQGIGEVTLNDAKVCVECVKIGSRWVHLRTCQACGRTHCCDSSPNKHATAHWHSAGHPVMASAEPGERWMWCYPHEQIAKYE
ncbi:MAG: UBP-type zinc finger domain-containing protein [Myxococcaceae bacterium]